MAGPTSLAHVADDLYALTPEEFTPTRNALSRDAKTIDAELARNIVLLRKPAPAAWLVNMLVRHRAEPVEAALALGQAMTDAANCVPTLRRPAPLRGTLGRSEERSAAGTPPTS